MMCFFLSGFFRLSVLSSNPSKIPHFFSSNHRLSVIGLFILYRVDCSYLSHEDIDCGMHNDRWIETQAAGGVT